MRAALLAACTALAGCAAEPVAYHSQNEIPPGPGLFTGPQGAFVLRTYSARPRDAAEEREFQEWREWKQRQDQ
jgi:hypothetical protein